MIYDDDLPHPASRRPFNDIKESHAMIFCLLSFTTVISLIISNLSDTSFSSMRALVVTKYAHPTQIPLDKDAPEPKPSSDRVIVEVYSAGLNFFDVYLTSSRVLLSSLLLSIASVAQTFVSTMKQISNSAAVSLHLRRRPGDRVFGFSQGAYADRVAANWKQMLPLPRNMTYDQGAGLHITWPTSYEALVGRGELKPGDWVLVIAAAGGVGLAAVQLAKALGAKVIGAAGSPEKMEICKRYGGADFAVNYTTPDWQKEVRAITNGHGADIIYDPVGRIRDSLKCIAWKGRAIVVGFAGGQIEKLPLNLVLLKNIAVTGIFWGAYDVFEPERYHTVWRELLQMIESGRVKPIVYPEVFDLEHVGDGLRAIEERRTWGKAVVRVRPDDSEAARAKL
ncbi:alcohol dehydrogenase [Sanghuangporus baumii]|uniref:Alcohol dehydrogenase n=1 Tax=Sanghuangporus baumii TaxID=108892 RepID=A0A9Q5N8G1_SANBA|nr:alcohol dehydrogenase [Sanghuangporus baumii]